MSDTPEGFAPVAERVRSNVTPLPTARRTVRVVVASELVERQAPERRFHVDPLIPAMTVTTLGGDGGTGKSLLALQLGVATAAGGIWCGRRVTAGGCIYISAEDDVDELHRRLETIAERQGISPDRLKQLRIIPLAGEDAVIAASNGAVLQPAPLYATIEDLIDTHRPALIVLDTLADLFGGSENDRAHVRQFVGMIRGWAIRYDVAVLMLAHPSLTGMSSGSGNSGSTAWNNSVRSRLYLDRVKGEESLELDPDARVLRTLKANYGRVGGEIRMRWQEGIFVTVDDPNVLSGYGAAAAEARVDRVFLDVLSKRVAEGRHVSPHRNAPTYAPPALAKDPRCEGLTKRALEGAMERMLAGGTLRVGQSEGPPSRRRDILVITPSEAAE